MKWAWVIMLTTGCFGFDSQLEACRAGEGPCAALQAEAGDSGTITDAGNGGTPVDAGNGCTALRTYYRDADKDGFGDPASPQVACGAAPAGFVADKTDCCDRDAQAHPGQKAFFAKPDACDSFDYDCSGANDVKLAVGFTGWTFQNLCALNGMGTDCAPQGKPGWGTPAMDTLNRKLAYTSATAIPACGETGTLVNGCTTPGDCNGTTCACGKKTSCEFDVTSEVQSCH